MENYEVFFVILLSVFPAIADLALFIFIVLLAGECVVSWFRTLKKRIFC